MGNIGRQLLTVETMIFKFVIFLYLACVTATNPDVLNKSTTAGNCPEGWLDASFVDLGCLTFQYDDDGKDWWDAFLFCRERNSFLLEIFTEPQFDFLRLELQVYEEQYGAIYWYIGASDDFEEDAWYWTNSWQPVNSFIWTPGYPSNGEEGNFLCFMPNSYYAADCDGLGTTGNGFICQRK